MAHDAMLVLLKQKGPLTIRGLQDGLGISETTVRHHITRLVREGLITIGQEAVAGVGRPASLYQLTHLAEGVFPKHYAELLDAVLSEAEALGVIQVLFERIAEAFSTRLKSRVAKLKGEAALQALLDGLDFGDMLATLRVSGCGWELQAHNCLYRTSGQRFVEVCDLLPAVITKTHLFAAERLVCQRDGHRSCNFFVSAVLS